MEDEWPLMIKLSKGKAIKPSTEIHNHRSKKAFKFNYFLISQNTNLWKTSFGKNSIPTKYIQGVQLENMEKCSFFVFLDSCYDQL